MTAKFFRGENRTDWLFTLMLCASFDFDDDALTQSVADQLGFVTLERFTPPFPAPPVGIVVTTDYVFVVCGETRSVYQWIGNILGSVQGPAPMVDGNVSLYFYTIARYYYSQINASVQAWLAGRQLVFIGFSLGGATGTVLKAMFKKQLGIDAAGIFPASPRVGDPAFVAGVPSDNLSRISVNTDPIPGVPPIIWTKAGIFYGFTPYPPLTTYSHVSTGYTLTYPNKIDLGDNILPLSQIVLNFNLGSFKTIHDPSYYATIVRGGLPDMLQDGQDGYTDASSLDLLASRVFNWINWPWFNEMEGSPMPSSGLVQVSIGIRDISLVKGYQEVYFYQANDPQVVFNAFNTPSFASNLSLRANFLSQSCEIYFIRVSAVAPSARQSLLQKFTPTIKGAISTDETEIDNDLAFFHYSQSRTYKRQVHYGGIPNDWIDGDKLTATGLANIPVIDLWFGRLKGLSTYCIKAKNFLIIPPATSPEIKFLAITKDPVFGTLILQMDNVYNIPANSLAVIGKIRGFPLLRGTWLLKGTGGIAAGTVEVQNTEGLSPPVATPGSFRVIDPTNATVIPTAISQVFNGASIRKRGRPLFQPRGRRSALLRHL